MLPCFYKRGKMKIKLITAVIMAAVLGIYAVSCGTGGNDEDVSGGVPDSQKEVVELSLVCVGDIMAHKPQYESAYDSTTGTYNFDSNYDYVREYIEEADIALCNVETVFADKPPCGYPTFNAPDELASAIKNAGFDVAITSNNHMLDQGTAGVERSLQVLKNAGLSTVGSKLTEEEPDYTIVEAEGVRVGIVAYTYETTGTNTQPSINGMNIPADAANRICSFNPSDWQNDITEIKDNVNAVREAGADIVVCYFHWGEEYHSQPQEYQVNMANEMIADTGVDVIFASHPHVLEPAVVIWSEAQQKNVPVYYSMGNFISNQRSETLGANRRNTEDGMIAGVKFEITKVDGKAAYIEMVEANALPTWVNRYKSGGKWAYDIIPLDYNYGNNQSLTVSGNVARADKSIVDSLNIIGSNYDRDEAGRILLFDADKWKTENAEQ